jgi:hypothetical protein
MATAQHAPIYVSLDVWDEVEDIRGASNDSRGRPTRRRERRARGLPYSNLRVFVPFVVYLG